VSHGHPELSHGGAEIASYRLFQSLRELPDVEAYYLARTDDSSWSTIEGSVVEFGRPNEMLFYTNTVDNFFFSQKSSEASTHFIEFIRRIDPDVVHFHHYYSIGLELITECRKFNRKIKIVVTLHEYLAICHHFGQMVKPRSFQLCTEASAFHCHQCFPVIPEYYFETRKKFIKAIFDRVDLFVAPSRFLRKRYVEWGLPRWQIIAIDNGVTPLEPVPPRPLQPGETRGHFAFFGQINPFKGLLELLRAFRLLDQFPQTATSSITLTIHGAYLELNPPPYVSELRELLAVTSPRVQFVGPYRNENLRELMGAVDWVVVPSVWWENSPLVIEEALACGRPILCSDIGGMAEKVRAGLDGYHFRVGDSADLAQAIVRTALDLADWMRLQRTIRRPTTQNFVAQRHMEVYRDRSFTFI